MNKISSITLTFVFILSFFGVSLLSPQKASAASISSAELKSKASKLQKLELLRKCVESRAFLDGFTGGSSPFSSEEQKFPVGHLVDKKDGKWVCEDGSNGSRENQLFSLLLVNGSKKVYYKGFLGGGDLAYTANKNKNVKDVKGDDDPIYRYINKDNKTDYNMNLENDGLSLDEARNKIYRQINESRDVLYEGLSGKEKNALRYENLGAAFYSKDYGCKAKEIDVSNRASIPEGTAIVKVGDTSYEVGAAQGRVSVGFGELGSGDGDLSCEVIARNLTNLENDWRSVTKISGQIPPGEASGDSGSSTTGADDSCEGQSGVTGWFGCPIINIIGSTTTWIDEQVQNLMVLQPNQYKENDGLKAAWTGFRNIALSLLVAAMMVIVISTALGLSFLDAYTVKKAFPRLIVSIIFILLSWWLCILLIDVTTSIGQGLLGIMQAPFGEDIDTGNISTLFVVDGNDGALQGGALFVGTVSIFATQGALGIVGTWLGGALLVLLIAFVTLIARQMFIIVLILFAPLAILAWIFPGSAKAWQFWWSNFTKLLLMYPMVMALIGAGRIFAFTAADTFTGLYGTIIKLTAYVIPYALIPFTFKAAGGVFGSVASKIQDSGRPSLDRLRKRRQQGYAQVGRNAKSGDLLRGGQGDKGVIGRLNAGVARASTGPQGRFGFGERGAKARAINRATFGAEAAKDPRFGQFLVNDGDAATVMALSGGTNNGAQGAVNDLVDGHMADFMRDNPAATQQDIKNKREELQSRFSRAYQGAAAMGINRSNATAALSNMGANKGYGLATGDLESLNQGIKRMGGGNTEQEALMGTAQYSLRGAGRLDVGGGLGDRSAPIDERDVLMDSIKKTGFNAEVANSPAATKQIARVATADAARASTMGTDDRRDTAVMAGELVDGLQYGATGEARDNTLAMLTSLGINPDQSPDVIKDQLMQCYGFTTGYVDKVTGLPPPPPSGRAYIGPLQEIALGNRQRTANRAAGGPPPPVTSDLRLKRDIIYLGLTYSGIRIYKFKYIWSNVEYVGVMAQDVIYTHPDAVITDKWGYYKVDYDMLDLKFMTHEEWQRNLINKVKENTV